MRKVGLVNCGEEAKTFGAVVETAVLVAMMMKFLVPRRVSSPEETVVKCGRVLGTIRCSVHRTRSKTPANEKRSAGWRTF
jgi:hypothetical protein